VRGLEITCSDPSEKREAGLGYYYLGYYYKVKRDLDSGRYEVLCCNCNAIQRNEIGATRKPIVQKKYPRHPITMENSREETIRRMQSFPERAENLRELIRAREADAR
jgi:hypothetical protein